MTVHPSTWCCLSVGVIGGGIGGLATALSLRRAGHAVTIYERADAIRDAGASISCAANGTKWLAEWGVDITLGNPIQIRSQIRHALETGEVGDVLDLSDYVEKWGHNYYNFYRFDMHTMLMEAATGPGEGQPAVLRLNHTYETLDAEKGVISFTNGTSVQHDIVIGAGGVGSSVRRSFGIIPERKRATATCYYCLITSSDVQRLGLSDMMRSDAIEYWGNGEYKVVLSACRGGSVQSLFIFSPVSPEDIWKDLETCDAHGISDQVLQPFPGLDPRIRRLFTHAIDIRPWRLFEHSPFPTWHMGRVCLMGDAAHPMMPDQSQGACQAIEDAAALGIIFSKRYKFTSDINAGLCMYERVRKPRASKVQAASARARTDISERIGFSTYTRGKLYKVADESNKLTIEEINGYDMQNHIALEAPVEYRRPEWVDMNTASTSVVGPA